MKNIPIILGITGASGAVYGYRLLEILLRLEFQVELVLSNNSIQVAKAELDLDLSSNSLKEILGFLNLEKYSNLIRLWPSNDIAAAIASGSFKTQGMIIAPASMGTIANIAHGTSNNLITRAADVCLKERRKLVLLARETPLSSIHLSNMLSLSQNGAIILPACPGFYHNPQNINDLIDFVLGKVLNIFDIDHKLFKSWEGLDSREIFRQTQK